MKKIKHLMLYASILLLTQCQHEDINLLNYDVQEHFKSTELKVNSILICNQGIKWFGTDKGLYSFNDEEWVKYTEFDQKITTITQDKSGALLFGSFSGVSIVSGSYGNYERVGSYSSANSGLVSNMINTINIDPQERQWYGTFPGIIYNEKGNWSAAVLERDESKKIQAVIAEIQESNISSIAFIDDHYFIATLGNYLFNLQYDAELDAITGASQMTEGFTGQYTSDTIFCVIGDTDHFVWYGSNTGLTKNHRSETGAGRGHIEYFLGGEKVFSLLKVSNGNIWAGSDKGVSNYAQGTWTTYTIVDGISGNNVYAIVEESNGTIWIGTDNGISSFNGGIWRKYD